MKYIVLLPAGQGFYCIGPFDSMDEAFSYAEVNGGTVRTLHAPVPA